MNNAEENAKPRAFYHRGDVLFTLLVIAGAFLYHLLKLHGWASLIVILILASYWLYITIKRRHFDTLLVFSGVVIAYLLARWFGFIPTF